MDFRHFPNNQKKQDKYINTLLPILYNKVSEVKCTKWQEIADRKPKQLEPAVQQCVCGVFKEAGFMF